MRHFLAEIKEEAVHFILSPRKIRKNIYATHCGGYILNCQK